MNVEPCVKPKLTYTVTFVMRNMYEFEAVCTGTILLKSTRSHTDTASFISITTISECILTKYHPL